MGKGHAGSAPEGAKEESRSVFRPSGAWGNTRPRCPRAYALGWILPPLQGCEALYTNSEIALAGEVEVIVVRGRTGRDGWPKDFSRIRAGARALSLFLNLCADKLRLSRWGGGRMIPCKDRVEKEIPVERLRLCCYENPACVYGLI